MRLIFKTIALVLAVAIFTTSAFAGAPDWPEPPRPPHDEKLEREAFLKKFGMAFVDSLFKAEMDEAQKWNTVAKYEALVSRPEATDPDALHALLNDDAKRINELMLIDIYRHHFTGYGQSKLYRATGAAGATLGSFGAGISAALWIINEFPLPAFFIPAGVLGFLELLRGSVKMGSLAARLVRPVDERRNTGGFSSHEAMKFIAKAIGIDAKTLNAAAKSFGLTGGCTTIVNEKRLASGPSQKLLKP